MTEHHSSCIKVSDTNICPFCYSDKIIKNGTTKTKKQQYICKNCNRRFLDFYTYKAYLPNLNLSIIQFIKEGLGIRSIARILKISTCTLLKRIVFIASEIKQPPIKLNQAYEVDEMRTFIKKKSKLYWLVYALNKETKEIVSFIIGKRNCKTLSSVSTTLQNSSATKIFTDSLPYYKYLIEESVHSVRKYGTNYIERRNLSIRTHIKRLNTTG